MRFFLDNNVDADVATVIRAAGHECWLASEIGLNRVVDDALTVYASNKDAVLITHDQEFSRRRRRNTVGRHILLRCPEWVAPQLLHDRLREIIPILTFRADVVITISTADWNAASHWD